MLSPSREALELHAAPQLPGKEQAAGRQGVCARRCCFFNGYSCLGKATSWWTACYLDKAASCSRCRSAACSLWLQVGVRDNPMFLLQEDTAMMSSAVTQVDQEPVIGQYALLQVVETLMHPV